MGDLYEQKRTPNQLLRRQRELRGWSRGQMAKELQTLFPGVAVTDKEIARWENGKRRPGPYYREKLCALFETTADKLGFISLDSFVDQNTEEGETAREDKQIDTEAHDIAELRDIIQIHRQLLQTTLNQACTTLTLIPSFITHSEDNEQLMRAITQPSCINSDTLNHLFEITRTYWEMVDNAPLDFLSDMCHHFYTIMRIVSQNHIIHHYRRLCSLAGQHALVIGRTLYDLREYKLALSYCTFSAKIALEIGNEDLRATSLGRMALVLFYSRQPVRANLYLHEAQQIRLQHPWIGAWLYAIEAELHAHGGNLDAFMKAMETSKNILARYPVEKDVYSSITRFNHSMQLGFEGASLLRLKKPDAAAPVLQQSLSTLHPSSLRRRSTLLTDLGKAYALEEDVKEACTYFHQALDIIAQTKVLSAIQRVYSAKRDLDQWKHDSQVETLAEHITNTIAIIRRTNNE